MTRAFLRSFIHLFIHSINIPEYPHRAMPTADAIPAEIDFKFVPEERWNKLFRSTEH